MIIVLIILIVFVLWVIRRMTRKPDLGVFNLYFGSPGCGKTTFMARIALVARKKHHIYTNFPVKIPGVRNFTKDDIGKYAFPEGSLILFDEGSLNGFDNRDFKTNFKDNNALEYFKLLRHYKNSIVFANQGFNELDKKIRTLTTVFWLVRKVGPFSFATRVKRFTMLDPIQRQVIDGYDFPSMFNLIFNSRYIQIVFRKRYYKYFDSYDRPYLDPIPDRYYQATNTTA